MGEKQKSISFLVRFRLNLWSKNQDLFLDQNFRRFFEFLSHHTLNMINPTQR